MSHTFRWEHPANEVFVTGTFDNWSKSVKLDKLEDGAFETSTALPRTDEKISYKFVVDGEWKHDPTAKTGTDHEGNINNVLDPEDMQSPSFAQSSLSSVGPGASTAEMAGEQPVEKKSSTPGAFPEEPSADDNQTFSVAPIPATGYSDIQSSVRDDPELKAQDEEKQQTYSVSPIPATGASSVQETVKTDQASYEKSDTLPQGTQTSFQGPGSLQDKVPAAALFGGPGPVIPESSTPMGNSTDITKEDTGPTISSVAPGSSTNELAGQQPIQSRGVPEVVTESQKEAGWDPEAAGSPEAVEEKRELEQELQKKVSQEPSISDSGMLGESEDGAGAKAAAGVAAAGVATAGAAVAANEVIKDKSGTDPKSALPESVQDTVDDKAKDSSLPEKATEGTSTGASTTDAASEAVTGVPEEVTESQKEAGVDPEAAANAEAVTEKSEVEKELLSKVPTSDAQGEPAPTETAAIAESAPTASTSESSAPQIAAPAAAAPLYMNYRQDEPSHDGLNASKDAPAEPPTTSEAPPAAVTESQPVAPTESEPAPASQVAEKPAQLDSRDVSPMGKPSGQSEPQVTSGVASASTPSKNGPSTSSSEKRRSSFMDKLKGTPESSKTTSTTDSKKEKRRSFFGRIKDKLKHRIENADPNANGSVRDKGKGKAVDASDSGQHQTHRKVEYIPPEPTPPVSKDIPSPPPFLPPRRSKSSSLFYPFNVPPLYIPRTPSPAASFVTNPYATSQPPYDTLSPSDASTFVYDPHALGKRRVVPPSPTGASFVTNPYPSDAPQDNLPRNRLHLPENAEEANRLSRGNIRAPRLDESTPRTSASSGVFPRPPTPPSPEIYPAGPGGYSRLSGVESDPNPGLSSNRTSDTAASLGTNFTAPSSTEVGNWFDGLPWLEKQRQDSQGSNGRDGGH